MGKRTRSGPRENMGQDPLVRERMWLEWEVWDNELIKAVPMNVVLDAN